jgi:hypothetical protein
MHGAAASAGAAARDGMAGDMAEAEWSGAPADVPAAIPALEGRVAGDPVAATQAVGTEGVTEVAATEVGDMVADTAGATEVAGSETTASDHHSAKPAGHAGGFLLSPGLRRSASHVWLFPGRAAVNEFAGFCRHPPLPDIVYPAMMLPCSKNKTPPGIP